MARINIEDSLYKEKRFEKLMFKLGGRRAALGALVEAYVLAQKHYLNEKNDGLIPFEEWEREEIAPEILECGLAERRDKGIYIKGSETQFCWLKQKSNSGKVMSQKKLESLAKNRSKRWPKKIRTDQNGIRTDVNGSEALSLSLSQEREINTIAQNEVVDNDSHLENAQRSAQLNAERQRVGFNFDEFYASYPKKVGRQRGHRTFKAQIKTEKDYEDLKLAARNYYKYIKSSVQDAKYIKNFDTFMNNWRDWLDPDAGKVDNSLVKGAPAYEVPW